MEDMLCKLNNLLSSSSLPSAVLPILRDAISLITTYQHEENPDALPELLGALLTTVIRPLFTSKVPSSSYATRFSEITTKTWKGSAPWSLDVLKWILDQYGILDAPRQKHTIESQFQLLVPPILTLLDDNDIAEKKAGCNLLELLSNRITNCQSEILQRTGLVKVFEDSLAHNMLLLPSLTPEDQSLDILRSLYPAYRALIRASFPKNSSSVSYDSGKFYRKGTGSNSLSHKSLGQRNSRQAMLDRMLRGGILAGYMHASEHVQIADLLVSEMSSVVGMMGASSAKYLSQLLPLLRSILTNPFGPAYQSLLKSAIAALRQLILQCWPRIAEVWWGECTRAIVGLWLSLSDEDDSTTKQLKDDAKGVMDILVQLKGQAVAEKDLQLLQAEYNQLEGLFLTRPLELER